MVKDAVGDSGVNDKTVRNQGQEAQERVKEFFSQKPFEELGEDVCIWISDLVGSTPYKQQHGQERGLAKIYLHNELSLHAVTQHQGEVSKFLGDGILAVFRGPDAARRGVEAARTLLDLLAIANEDGRFKYPHDISTKVSLHYGRAWFYRYPVANAEDPQGSAVDLAARLQQLAAANHVIMTTETLAAAGGQAAFADDLQFSKEYGRFLTGFVEEFQVVTMARSNRELQKPRLIPQHREIPGAVVQSMREAHEFLRQKRFDDADSKFLDVLKSDPGNFEANYRLGERYLQRSNGVRTLNSQEQLRKAWSHLCHAKKVRPDIARIWLYLSFTKFKEFIRITGMHTEEALNEAIEYAKESVSRATEAHDIDALAEGKTFHARLLLEKHERYSMESTEYLTQAEALCAEVHNLFDGTLDQHRSNLLVTHALVRMAKYVPKDTCSERDPELEEIHKMIVEAQRLYPKSVRAKEADVKLTELQNHNNNDPPSPLMLDF